ncbi:MAG TPA: hypothetical protein VK841_23965 [Polyangiaceae bacterium]|jgi:hypothetical protein|nr:hypothetical protein [Polyangiaceae bacterium]
MGRVWFAATAGALIVVAGAGTLSCAGSVQGGDTRVTVSDYGGSVFIALGPQPDVTAEFEEFDTVLAGGASASSLLASLNDGTRECLAGQSPVQPTADDTPITTHTVGAGAITITGGATPLTLLPEALDAGASVGSDIHYGPAEATGLAPDDVVTITATGDSVPAFALSLPLPSAITWTQPPAVDSPWVIDRSTDLAVAWNGGTTGSVTIGIEENVGSNLVDVECTFAASAGGGAFPASLLAYLPPTTPASNGTIVAATVAGSVRDSVSLLVGGRWNITANGQNGTFSTTATIE